MRARATLERYGEAAIPPDSTLVDWPLGYGELEPYYALVEHAIGISGEAGSNPFEGPRSRAYPMPPLRRTGWTELMSDAALRLGWHPHPTPTAINSEPYNGNPACTYCGFCENNGCHNGAKGSPDNNVLPRAEATGNLHLHHVRPGDPGRGGSRRSRHGRRLREERAGARPASGGRDARRTHIRERPADAVVQVGRTSGGPANSRVRSGSGSCLTSIRRRSGSSRAWISRFLPARGLRGLHRRLER